MQMVAIATEAALVLAPWVTLKQIELTIFVAMLPKGQRQEEPLSLLLLV
jgi:hypothetical protein